MECGVASVQIPGGDFVLTSVQDQLDTFGEQLIPGRDVSQQILRRPVIEDRGLRQRCHVKPVDLLQQPGPLFRQTGQQVRPPRSQNLPGLRGVLPLVLQEAAQGLAHRPWLLGMAREVCRIEHGRPFLLGELSQPGDGRSAFHLQELENEQILIMLPLQRQGFGWHDAGDVPLLGVADVTQQAADTVGFGVGLPIQDVIR